MDRWRSLGEVLEHDLSAEALADQPPCLATGLPDLDKALGGGFRPGLIVLGASPGLGKSTLALQMALHIQSPRTPVLYYSLEMPAVRLASKVISHRVFTAGAAEMGLPGDRTAARRWALSARELFSPREIEAFSPSKRRRMDEARTGGGDLFIVDRSLSAEEIAGDVRGFLAGRPGTVPFVIVDYLQILPKPRDRTLSDRQVVESNLRSLAALAQASGAAPYGLPVLLISSLNRDSYKQAIKMESFKETGGIEYAADVLLGLQFSACHGGKSFDVQREKNSFPRQVEISVLKQRYGGSGETVKLAYYAEYDSFVQRTGAPATAAGGREDAPAPAEGAGTAPGWEKLWQEGPPAYMGNAYVVNELRKGRARPGVWTDCPVIGRGKDAVITRFCLSAEVTGFDMCVADALYSLYNTGEKGFSLGTLLHALSGDAAQTATAQWKQILAASIGRLTAAGIEIDCAAENRQRGAGGGVEDAFSGPFLAAEPAGRERWRFTGEGVPLPLYRYTEQTHQIIQFPQLLLAVERPDGKKLRDSAENILIKRFLIQRIEIARNGRARKAGYKMNSIRYLPRPGEGMFSELGLEPGSDLTAYRRRCRTAHETVQTVLACFARIGYIRDWAPVKGQNGLLGPGVPAGVDIEL